MLFPVLFIGARFWYKTPYVKAEDMDFVTNIAEIEAETLVQKHLYFEHQSLMNSDRYDEPPPRNKMEAFWQWLVSSSSAQKFVYLNKHDATYRCERKTIPTQTSRRISRPLPLVCM